MKRTRFDDSRDQRIAAEAGPDHALMCSANGCPNRWTCDFAGRLCSAHAHAERHEWPAVTQQQQDIETERAYRAGRQQEPAPPLTVERKRQMLSQMHAALAAIHAMPRDGRAWARSLRDREQGGERLTPAQRDMWRAALGAQRFVEDEGAQQ